MNSAVYDPQNYQRLGQGPRLSATQIVPILKDLIAPNSVVDLGCGQGSWLDVFREHGVEKITAVDGNWASESLEVPEQYFVPGDLRTPIELPDQYDLAICMEAAHYLPPNTGDVLVTSLVNLAPVILLSAGIPFQSGTTGPNGQWPDFWQEKFAGHDYVLVDAVRPAIWENDNVTYYYRQNCILFVQREYLAGNIKLSTVQQQNSFPLRVVHPNHYLQKIEYLESPDKMATLGARALLKALVKSVRISLARRFKGTP